MLLRVAVVAESSTFLLEHSEPSLETFPLSAMLASLEPFGEIFGV